MSHSSFLGADIAPALPNGRGADLLGPSDNSDSGSDAVGTAESHADSDAAGTGERGSVAPGDMKEGGDILPDHVVRMSGEEDGEGEEEDNLDEGEFTDLETDFDADDQNGDTSS